MRSIWIALALAALAQEPPPTDSKYDIDVGDIDLSGPATGENGLTYTGGLNQRTAQKIDPAAAVNVSNPVGTTTVHCTDTDFLEARVDYTIEGTTQDPMKAYGDSIRLATTGGATSGSVKMLVGTRPPQVKGAKIDLVVNAPKSARLNVTGGNDWVKITGCNGTVTASAARNGLYVDGQLKSFNVTAGQGDVKVVVDGEAKIAANSAINAPKGGVTLIMGLAQDVALDARGTTVTVQHNVMGSVGADTVIGSIGAGGPKLVIKASGDVSVRSP